MDIMDIEQSESALRKFVEVPFKVYEHDTQWIPLIRDQEMAFFGDSRSFPAFCQFKGFVAVKNALPVGRVGCFINEKLTSGGKVLGTVGYYEVCEDISVSNSLLSAAYQWLYSKGIRRVWGPMNSDIFHGYRFMVKGFNQKHFCGEPFNHPYYPQYFEQAGFRPMCRWHSWDFSREQMQALVTYITEKILREEDDSAEHEIVFFDPLNVDQEIERLYRIMTKTFEESIGYTAITLEEFRRVYGILPLLLKKDHLVFMNDGRGETVGFLLAFPDISDDLRKTKGGLAPWAASRGEGSEKKYKTICLHSAGILKGQRSKGLFPRAFIRLLSGCLEYEKGIAALIRDNIPTVFESISGPSREYCLYEKMMQEA
jgi:hypothetical protein